ncbi:MAG TPA: glycosyltransferase family 29 protein [Oligoflexia bacterium]|nr:glycosyltransferase family 29 protein [Oligoflexia bacterium]HMP49839.1 glycosyltransferase family 29 protein [Oligoflexia bacterium]
MKFLKKLPFRSLSESVKSSYHELLDIEAQSFSFFRSCSRAQIEEFTSRLSLSDSESGVIFDLFSLCHNVTKEHYLTEIYSGSYRKKISILFEDTLNPYFVLSQNKILSRLIDYLKDSSVALVGPAAYLTGLNKGEEIESFDVVVRMNFQWPVSGHLECDYGKRMDILYHCCNGDFPLDSLIVNDIDKLKFACVERNLLSKKLSNELIKYDISTLYVTDYYKRASQVLDAYASTGMAAVFHLLSMPIRSLSIFGMTNLKSPYCENYLSKGAINNNYWKHSFDSEAKILLKIMNCDKRLNIDKEALGFINK